MKQAALVMDFMEADCAFSLRFVTAFGLSHCRVVADAGLFQGGEFEV